MPDGDHSTLEWLRPIDSWLADIAMALFQTDSFRLALIGHEVSGDTDAASLVGSVPDQRFIGYVLPHGDQFEYTAPNG